MQLNEEVLQLIAQRLKTMSEPARLRILQLLKDKELSVGEIADRMNMKHGTASANLNALAKVGLVTVRREGTKSLYRIGSDMVFKICDAVCDSLQDEFREMAKLEKAIRKRE